jgi:hypothetical protein
MKNISVPVPEARDTLPMHHLAGLGGGSGVFPGYTVVTPNSLTDLRVANASYQYSVAIAGSFAPDGTPVPPAHIVITGNSDCLSEPGYGATSRYVAVGA